jgi:hypothetical protein
MNLRSVSVLPLTATIQPGTTARVNAKPSTAFRLERLLVSPHSFPPALARRMWTWPIIKIGNVLGRAHRGLAKLLRVDLRATHERREYVSAEYAQTHEAYWDESEEDENDDDGRPFILIATPLNYRERLLAPLGRASRRLSQLRLSWQQAQLATLIVRNITISKQPQFVVSTPPLPADLLALTNFNFSTCTGGHEIEIEIHNRNRRACQLMMSLIGISADDRTGGAP